MFTASYRQGATEKLWPFRSRAAFYFVNPEAEVRVLTHRARGAARRSTRSHNRSEEKPGERAASPTFIILLVCPEKTGASTNARRCTGLEFSSGEINTMWPCRGSNCCPIWESLLIQDLRMGKLQSKHGKKAANSCWNKHRLTNQLWFDCITRAKEIICQQKII